MNFTLPPTNDSTVKPLIVSAVIARSSALSRLRKPYTFGQYCSKCEATITASDKACDNRTTAASDPLESAAIICEVGLTPRRFGPFCMNRRPWPSASRRSARGPFGLRWYSRDGERQASFAESQAAAEKQSRIEIEKAIGTIKAYLRDRIATAAKHTTRAH